ncbi:hypothetical protein BV96_02316 [Sphingomonas paucimobilis]|nr:hypothetical protein BV96_02316 [Sphingomonas paucimobilis]
MRRAPISHGFTPRLGRGLPSIRRARMIVTGFTIICPRIGPEPQQVGCDNILRATSMPATTWPKAA